MTTQEVAKRYMELEKQGKSTDIVTELYGDNILSIEPEHAAASGMPTRLEGIEAIKAKGKAFSEAIEEVHGGYCGDPIVVGNYFTMAMGMDVTMKGQQRMKMDEIAVFGVADGKIVFEQFFY